MRDYNDSQPIINPMSPGIIENKRRIGITINKTRNFMYWENIGFSRGVQHFYLCDVYKVQQLYMFTKIDKHTYESSQFL